MAQFVANRCHTPRRPVGSTPTRPPPRKPAQFASQHLRISGEERSAQLKVENSFRELRSPPGGQRSEKTAGGQSRDRSAARLRGYGVSNPFLDPIPWPRGATQLSSSSSPVGGLNPTITSPRANWRANISQDRQETKQRRPNPGRRSEQRPRIWGDFVAADTKAKSAAARRDAGEGASWISSRSR
jgi:hypothetical protein